MPFSSPPTRPLLYILPSVLRCYASRSVCAFYSLLLSWLLIWAKCSFGRNFVRSFSSSRMLMSTPFLTKMLADV